MRSSCFGMIASRAYRLIISCKLFNSKHLDTHFCAFTALCSDVSGYFCSCQLSMHTRRNTSFSSTSISQGFDRCLTVDSSSTKRTCLAVRQLACVEIICPQPPFHTSTLNLPQLKSAAKALILKMLNAKVVLMSCGPHWEQSLLYTRQSDYG